MATVTSSADSLSQEALKAIYLPNTRQRFKAEVNRMTSGGMAALLGPRADLPNITFLMSYVYIYHWLRHNVPEQYLSEVLDAFRKSRGFLMDLLENSADGEAFARGYIEYWKASPPESPIQRQQVLALLEEHGQDVDALVNEIMETWRGLNLLEQDYASGYKDLARRERERYDDMLGPEDKARLALVDDLPDVPGEHRFPKLGLIPAMGCPQTCRHCMFIFRPLMKNADDPTELYAQVNEMTDSVLFTGGDLTKQLDHFYAAISSMKNIRNFAILLNGDFADSRQVANTVIGNMAKAVRRRPITWPRAHVLLQISFDEFHQEVTVDKKGRLKERIPVKKIANIVETVPKYGEEVRLCLLHKQHALNFSMELFQKGVFARLANELASRGHQVQVLSASPSRRLKRNPLNAAAAPGQVIKDANFILTKYPQYTLMLTSSTIDAYGRAEMIDASEAVNERDLLQQVLEGKGAGGETFDKDLMFWFNGWATLFSAVHMCLGNVQEEGLERVLQRQKKDPLTQALHTFDLRLLEYYAEARQDLEKILDISTSPHHLFHAITEEGDVRLHMTIRLLGRGREEALAEARRLLAADSEVVIPIQPMSLAGNSKGVEPKQPTP
ncbi:MAG: radical SAM protein [bacterium]